MPRRVEETVRARPWPGVVVELVALGKGDEERGEDEEEEEERNNHQCNAAPDAQWNALGWEPLPK